MEASGITPSSNVIRDPGVSHVKSNTLKIFGAFLTVAALALLVASSFIVSEAIALTLMIVGLVVAAYLGIALIKKGMQQQAIEDAKYTYPPNPGIGARLSRALHQGTESTGTQSSTQEGENSQQMSEDGQPVRSHGVDPNMVAETISKDDEAVSSSQKRKKLYSMMPRIEHPIAGVSQVCRDKQREHSSVAESSSAQQIIPADRSDANTASAPHMGSRVLEERKRNLPKLCLERLRLLFSRDITSQSPRVEEVIEEAHNNSVAESSSVESRGGDALSTSQKVEGTGAQSDRAEQSSPKRVEKTVARDHIKMWKSVDRSFGKKGVFHQIRLHGNKKNKLNNPIHR